MDGQTQDQDSGLDDGCCGGQLYNGEDARISAALGVLSVLSTALSHTRTSVDSDLREEAGRYLVRRFREWKAEEELPAK